MVEIPVHIDTLEYTREGLSTRNPIDLPIGQHNRVVLVRPKREPSIAASYGGFPKSSSFPGPAVLSLLLHNHRPGGPKGRPFAQRTGGGKLQIFAHSDAAGSETANKALTDRRAKATYALLINDIDAMLDVANEENWGAKIEQVMLRALGCDPGPIDGTFEELTKAAVEAFQTRYAERQYHQPDDELRQPDLKPDSNLGPNTHEALSDAYVSYFSPRLDPSAFIEHSPYNGCAAYNPTAVPDDARNRRVSLVVHNKPLEYPDSIPCTHGDHMACPAVQSPDKQKCMWFREHVVELKVDKAKHHHFLPSWLPLNNGNYMLSVLTTVPDGEEITFQVFASKEPGDGIDLPDPSFYLHDIGAAIVNESNHGVAQVVWEPPSGFAPGEDGRADGDSGEYVPMFKVLHQGTATRLHDSYPATEIVVLFARKELEGEFSAHEVTTLELVHDLGAIQRKSAQEAIPYDSEYYALRFEGVAETGHYSLFLIHEDAVRVAIFEKVPFATLASGAKASPPPSTCAHWPFEDPDLEAPQFADEENDAPALSHEALDDALLFD